MRYLLEQIQTGAIGDRDLPMRRLRARQKSESRVCQPHTIRAQKYIATNLQDPEEVGDSPPGVSNQRVYSQVVEEHAAVALVVE